jgi:hypothetical protein
MLLIKLKKIIKIFQQNRRGNILLFVMVFGAISISIIILGVAGYAIFENKASIKKHNREMAFQIADAGVDYYRWHLAHDKNDYYDGNGTSTPGPYIHNYYDKDGNEIGKYSLSITPPPVGSSVVAIESTGWLNSQPESRRTIKIRVAFPSLTDYAFLTNSDVWIGDDEVMHGRFHSNGGIRFDGTADAPITSAVPSYYCQPIHGGGCNKTAKPGIWGGGGPTEYWNFPVPAKDFTEITASLAKMKTAAEADGVYLSSSGEQGLAITFTSDGNFAVRKVITTDCYKSKDIGDDQWVVRCTDAATYGPTTTYAIPANGFIYVDDMVWVDGVVNGKATIGVANGKSIIIGGNITYLEKDGAHVLGLIAEQDILLAKNAPDDLEINAALIAQNGATKRYDFSGEGGDDRKNSITIFGSVTSNGVWTWTWINQGGQLVSGYGNTNATYDVNLTFWPPPGFPVSLQYQLISWEVEK